MHIFDKIVYFCRFSPQIHRNSVISVSMLVHYYRNLQSNNKIIHKKSRTNVLTTYDIWLPNHLSI